MKTAVVTVTFNSGPVITAFLQCCSEQTLTDFELVIVDNKSTDDTLQKIQPFLDRLPIKLFASPENVGVAEGNNVGIRYALEKRFDTVMLINNDVEFEASLFKRLLEDLERNPRASAIVPRINYFTPKNMIWYGGGKFSYWTGPLQKHLHLRRRFDKNFQQPSYVDYAPTCLLLLRSSVFMDIGLMDPTYFVYFDDTDFCYRMKVAGRKIRYVPELTLFHKVSHSTGGDKSSFSIKMFTRNQMYFMRKFFPKWVWPYFYCMIQAKYLMRLFLGMDTITDFRSRQQAIREGFQMPVP